MDVVRFGLSMRALRRRRRWTQQRLADAVGVSRPVIGRIENGQADRVAVHTLVRVASALGATLSVRVLWHGEGLDRLLDAAHADLTERVLQLLQASGWVAVTEVSFNVRGDRGTIDILAFHESSGSLLVVEIKSVVPDLQSMLGTLDRKVRVAAEVARERGWRVTSVSRLLVFPDDRTSRRRVERHQATFDAVLPSRTAAVRRWIRQPVGLLAGVLFLPDAPHPVSRHRVTRPNGRARAVARMDPAGRGAQH
ncbi:MAG TPA: helix-turn-helix transcriptional regulator [Candidatus Limnocylindrales bacterium]|nr:helix-turn-helix transcriptional regulator [Candidatus Limnocylindrales bacterium]